MTLAKAMKNLKFDKRLTDINMKNGQLTNEELKQYLEQLPDLKEQVNMLEIEAHGEAEGEEAH